MELTAKFYLQAVNRGDCTHLMTKGREAYLTKLNAVCDAGPTLAPNSFRFENGILIADAVGQMASIYSGLAYVVIYSKQFDFWECYYIIDAKFSQNKIYFGLQKDLWGTYVPEAEFSDIHAMRCNRRIGNASAMYDAIRNKKPTPVFVPAGSESIDASEFSVVALIACTTAGDAEKSSVTPLMVATSLSDFVPAVSGKTQNILLAVSSFLGGIVEYKLNPGDNYSHKANTMRAWIVPKTWVTLLTPTDKYFAVSPTFYSYSGFGLVGQVKMQQVRPSETPETIVLKTKYGNDWDYIYPQNEVLFGPRGHMVEISRYDNPSVKLLARVRWDGLDVLISVNGEYTEITDAYELSIGVNSTQLSVWERIAKWSSFVTGIASRIGKGIMNVAGGNYLGATMQGIGIANESLQASAPIASPNANALTGGGAFVTYGGVPQASDNTKVGNPLYFVVSESLVDEKKHAYYYGLSIDAWPESFEAVQQGALYQGTGSETYFQGDCVVDYVPQASADYIRAELQRGIYYEC